MLRLSKIVKNYKETGALNENVSVYGFLDDQVFLTKGGDVGVVLSVEGVDYECLDYRQTDNLTKRLESALRLMGSQFITSRTPRLSAIRDTFALTTAT